MAKKSKGADEYIRNFIRANTLILGTKKLTCFMILLRLSERKFSLQKFWRIEKNPEKYQPPPPHHVTGYVGSIKKNVPLWLTCFCRGWCQQFINLNSRLDKNFLHSNFLIIVIILWSIKPTKFFRYINWSIFWKEPVTNCQ